MLALKERILVGVLAFAVIPGMAQEENMKSLSLQDLSGFKQQAGNWRIVGDVIMNPSADIHDKPETPAPAPSKKGKKNNLAPVEEKPKAVTFSEGKGILLNINDEKIKDHLVTTWEHGDIELELELMLPKGSNSGIYLQGRYEVQLLDSWGVKQPKYSDIGGIYRNWESEPGKIYMGKAPLSNPAKAPGLWQKMKIGFMAPRFDASGKKTSNARFLYVDLNGVRIHDNVEVPLPTGGPIENNEKPFGPLMIQGDHGPVAFRNIRYRSIKEVDVTVSNIAYQVHHGEFKSESQFINKKPVLSGTNPELTCEVLDVDNHYGVVYSGTVTIPEPGDYTFTIRYTGNGKLVVNNKTGTEQWGSSTVALPLQAGSYPFEIYNYKEESWMPPRLAFFAASANSYPKALHAFNSFPPDDNPVSSIYINPGSETRLLRAFIDFKGDYSKRLTHTVGVGDPSGIHYVYDMKSGNIVCAWRGEFVDATPMWHDRGDGSFRPRGAVQYFFMNQPLATIQEASSAFPATGNENEFRGKGYEIDEQTNRPIFKYIYKGVEVTQRIYPDENSRILTAELSLKNNAGISGLSYKLAEGSTITEMPDGTYAVDDKQYYIKVISGGKPTLRRINGLQELILPAEGQTIKYSIIW